MKIIIIGGSIGGLCAGIALAEEGFDVEIYERSPGDLQDRGAGLVIQHDMMEYLMERGVSRRILFGVPAKQRQVLDDSGRAILTYPNDTIFTSWNYLWKQLKDFFPSSRYFSDFELESIIENAGGVTAAFKNGAVRNADLLIGADGFNSIVREHIMPEVRPQYAGYVAYRGLIPESELTSSEVAFFADKFSIYPYAKSHLLCYLVPGPHGELTEGNRLYNWVWYQNKTQAELETLLTDKNDTKRMYNVPAGYLSDASRQELNMLADEQLPAILRNRIHQTIHPFVQVILDLEVPRMYYNRVAILGDAACLVKPHTASGTAKAYRDAITLAMNLQGHQSLEAALYIWNAHQLDHAAALAKHGRQLAAQSQLGYQIR
jgi:2-polyprenyl-6-methoxyphenol hydroxylase-like FAD-dependent oxidoreductase